MYKPGQNQNHSPNVFDLNYLHEIKNRDIKQKATQQLPFYISYVLVRCKRIVPY